jgi:transposase
MARYIGIDAHLESCTVAVMGPSGRKLGEEHLETNAEALRACITRIPKPRMVCIEEGLQSEWLYELLEPMAERVFVVQAEKRRKGNKNDSLDAWALADGLRREALPRPVYKAPGRFTELREAFRSYNRLTGDVVRTKNRLKAIYGARGLRCVGMRIYNPKNRYEFLQCLPPAQRKSAELLFDELQQLSDLREAAEQRLVVEAKRTPEVVRLATIPGIGLIRGAEIVATVVAPHRFRTRVQFRSYCGLAVVMASSSDWRLKPDGQWLRKQQATRGLNRNCNRHLKNVFKGAAQTIILHQTDPFYSHYQRMISNGTKPNLARLTIARRIADIALAIWKNGEVYDQKCIIAGDRNTSPESRGRGIDQ